jgi:hypothetical protein
VDNPLPYRILNALALIGAICFVVATFRVIVKTTRLKGPERRIALNVEVILLLLLLIYPSPHIYATTSMIRDAWIYFFTAMSIFFSVRMFESRHSGRAIYNFVLFLCADALLFSLRFYAAISILGGVLVAFCLPDFLRLLKGRMRVPRVFLVIPLALVLAFGFAKNFSKVTKVESAEQILTYQSSYGRREHGSNLNINYSSVPAPLLPFAFMYSLTSNTIGPLPWQVTNANTGMIFVLEVPLLWWIILKIYKHRKLLGETERYLLLQCVFWSIVLAIGHNNLGTSTRVRVVGWLPVFVVVGVVLYRSQRDRYNAFVARQAALGGSLPPEPA